MSEDVTGTLKTRLGEEGYQKISRIGNPALDEFLAKYIILCNPHKVFICTDSFSRQENKFLIQQLRLFGCNAVISNRNRIKFCKSTSEFSLEKYENFKYIKNKQVKYFDYQKEGIKFLNIIQRYMHDEYKYKFSLLHGSSQR